MVRRIRVSFRVTGFAENMFDRLARLNVAPIAVWRRGDLRHPCAKMIHEENGWELRSCLPETETVEVHVRSLCVQLATICEQIKAIPAERHFSCAISILGEDVPELSLSPETIAGIHALNAGLDFDVIVFPTAD